MERKKEIFLTFSRVRGYVRIKQFNSTNFRIKEKSYRENNSIQVCVRWLNRRDNIHFRPEKMIYELYIVVRTAKISNFGRIN